MELTAAEEKQLKVVAKCRRRCERHPIICQCVVWGCLVLAGMHGFGCVSSGVAAYRLATAKGRSLESGFMRDMGAMSDREQVDEVLTAHVLLTKFWQAVAMAGAKSLAAVFFVLMFFYVRHIMRDQALLVKLHRRVTELETSAEGA
jgi:hypothetical protein